MLPYRVCHARHSNATLDTALIKCGHACGFSLSQSIQAGCPEYINATWKCLSSHSDDSPRCREMTRNRWFRCVVAQRPAWQSCIQTLQDTCMAASIHVTKEHRLSMVAMGALIQEMSNLKVIHYVRDPRGIVLSRFHGMLSAHGAHHSPASTMEAEAKGLCPEMFEDIKARKRLSRSYPGAFLTLKYEDFVLQPQETFSQIQRHIGSEIPEQVQKKVLFSANATKALAWKSRMEKTVLEKVTMLCRGVLDELGYET